MSVTTYPRRTAAVIGSVLLIALMLVCVGYQWSRSYADGAPRVTPLSATDPATLARKTYLIDCGHDPVARPSEFTLTCGDANTAIEHTQWTRWGGTRALATATYVENTCTPYCAAGHLAHYPARVVAKGLVRKDGTGRYRVIVVHFPGAHPDWVKHHRARFEMSTGSVG